MTLSIIIVNYNVKYFLEQCLYSVQKAASNQSTEVIVVDNHSSDGSLEYLQPLFPAVHFITSASNSGFGKACNLGLQKATGEYILFLNPDTIVAEDSFETCISFFKTHPHCGALGVKMIDGSGRFLKESKRAFPSPTTSLFKLAGLAHLFPRSAVFSRYHLGHLSPAQVHEVDVLAGAFLMTTSQVLHKTGAFDEAFFMYGEDVDLSYRIQKAGYKNYYIPHTTIIHFKGESTRRGSLNYVRMFYQAMSIFVKKHYGGARAGIFHFSIQLAIWLRAGVAAIAKFIKWVGLPVVDAALIFGTFYLVKQLWLTYVRPGMEYPQKLLLIFLPLLTLVYLLAVYYAGLYDKQYKTSSLLRSTLVATITLLTVYSLLPETFRFSRGIMVVGAVSAFVVLIAERWLLAKAHVIAPSMAPSAEASVLVAGNGREFGELKKLFGEKGFHDRIIGRIGINGQAEKVAGHITELADTVQTLNARELLFCAGALSYKQIIGLSEAHCSLVKFRYHATGSGSVVGSDTSTESGETLSAGVAFNLDKPYLKRAKRLIDISTALLLLLTWPVHLLFVRRPLQLFLNCLAVLLAQKTWVGYTHAPVQLPLIRKGVVAANGKPRPHSPQPTEAEHLLNYWYARNYKPTQDARTIFAAYKNLGAL